MSPLSGILQYLSSWDWLLSLSIMFSRFIRVVAFARIPFLFQSWKIFHYRWTPHFAYPSTCSGHLGYFHTLAVFVFLFLASCMVCGILVSWPASEPGPSAVKALSPNHWTAKELPTPQLLWTFVCEYPCFQFFGVYPPKSGIAGSLGDVY